MTVKPLNFIIAYKALALTPKLNERERRVGAALLDHYNRKTGRCDPSFNTLSDLLEISRSTVIRAVAGLVRHNFFQRAVHGGRYHCNFYHPVWSTFFQVETNWANRRLARRRRRTGSPDLTPERCLSERAMGLRTDTQTCPSNLSKKPTLADPLATKEPPVLERSGSRAWQDRSPTHPLVTPIHRLRQSSRDCAANDAAERRWSSALDSHFSKRPEIYARIIEAVDASLREAATDAELKCIGTGVRLIFRTLIARSVLSEREL